MGTYGVPDTYLQCFHSDWLIGGIKNIYGFYHQKHDTIKTDGESYLFWEVKESESLETFKMEAFEIKMTVVVWKRRLKGWLLEKSRLERYSKRVNEVKDEAERSDKFWNTIYIYMTWDMLEDLSSHDG